MLGIDKIQLSISIRTIYGKIDVDNYLRRLFDMEFILSTNDSGKYCKSFNQKNKFSAHFQERQAKGRIHSDDYGRFIMCFEVISYRFGLTLREIEHYYRLFIFVDRNTHDNHHMYPIILNVLILLKIKNNIFYREYVQGVKHAGEVVDYFSKCFLEERVTDDGWLAEIECDLYCAEYIMGQQGNGIIEQLKRLVEESEISDGDYLSERLKRGSKEKAQLMFRMVQEGVQKRGQAVATRNIVLNYIIPKLEICEIR